MGGTDIPGLIGAWPGVLAGGGTGLAFFFLVRVMFSMRRQLEKADARTAAERQRADRAERVIDIEREKRRNMEDRLSASRSEASVSSAEAKALRAELDILRNRERAA